MTDLFDPGLQPERTALAWRRTCLAILGGSVIAARILPETFGGWSSLLGLAGIVFAAGMLFAVHRRYDEHHRRLRSHGDHAPIAGGVFPGLLALFTLAAAVVAIALFTVVAAR